MHFFQQVLDQLISPMEISRILHLRRILSLTSIGYSISTVKEPINFEYLDRDRVESAIRLIYGYKESNISEDSPLHSLLQRIENTME